MSRFRSLFRFGGGGALASLAVVALAAVADAGTITLEAGDYWGHGGAGGWSATAYGGGEFRVQGYSGPNIAQLGAGVAITTAQGSSFNSLFQTFCVEYNEEYYPGGTYEFDINTGTINGGFSAAGPPPGPTSPNLDPLSYQTAWLFTQFWTGNLAAYGYNYTVDATNGRALSATALQLAIWHLEGEAEQATNPNAYNAYNSNTLAKQFVADAAAAGWTDIGGVRVMNLYTLDSHGNKFVAQDQLVILDEGVTIDVVPLPSAGLMGITMMSGLGLVAAWRRRRKPSL